MRKLLLFPALLMFCIVTYAEQESNIIKNVTSNPVVPGPFPHFDPINNDNNKTTTQELRLIAKAYSLFQNGNMQHVDSITYKYSGSRGSVPNLDDMNNDDHVLFDESVTYTFNSTQLQYKNNLQRIQSYLNNKVQQLIYKEWIESNSSWKNKERFKYTYDTDGKMESMIKQRWYGTLWAQDMTSTLAYDPNNNVVSLSSTTYTMSFVYDANNRLVEMEDMEWTQAAGWQKKEKKSYVYTGNDVKEYTLEKWGGSSWEKNMKRTYQYDANKNLIISVDYGWVDNNWKSLTKHSYAYDNNNNVIADVTYNWNSIISAFVEAKKEVRSYNNKSLVEELTTYSWDGTNWVQQNNDISIRYYYESYDPTTVNFVAQNIDGLNIYPVPASDQLNIAYQLHELEKSTIALLDMTGKVVYSMENKTALQYNGTIPVANIPEGNYIVSISSPSSSTYKKVSIVH